jgi:hypothetical protein
MMPAKRRSFTYDAATPTAQLNARPSDIPALPAGTLDPEHEREVTEKLHDACAPV